MISRRKYLRTGCLAVVLGAHAVVSQPAHAVDSGDLREQIKFTLEPRTPAENAFLDRVILLVEQDKLSIALVRRMFQWARSKRPYPFPYFRRALTIQASRMGVNIEAPFTPETTPRDRLTLFQIFGF